ncbi:ImmA/IrrE family metallo-endopeptidase [Nocardia farcinica]|uniref:helix-turn-helix domain-containing protein n=1 Tax=Nocardia farcinica TaxID=37329 RepID=UPI0009E8CDF5|nr:XRE family transcriptional regulator [Nocardia farcinica]AXK86299.1 helix-turn-helix domain-containing protein [Nocardia farcinica]MBA4859068.1 ImmA/IrrE family metallo-endopeptidase [Nocardia farcinica]MBC9817501.1 ImmA/IrrE family metallo-endopeptidase [Nocardia farcinica]MBF6263095.1 ImmA/IrrE family metallo-endopeptidase [Nocardia farcinica]MBF6281599.1 ImmA/IrrE family metallo-endopeptidase [Nocardia farcinica]
MPRAPGPRRFSVAPARECSRIAHMTELPAGELGDRIAQARSRHGLTQAQLAAAIGIDRSALAKIEGGTRRVSALELAGIAEELGERIEWFVLPSPPAIVSHRNLQEPGTPSPEIDKLLERLAWNVEFMTEHDRALGLDGPVQMAKPGSIAEAEEAARSARERLGLDDAEPARDIGRKMGELGLLVFSFELGADAADAASLLLRAGGIALINGSLQVGRRRLALAHEFGHYLFADEYTVDWRLGAAADTGAWETRLDRFARAVLLPVRSLPARWREYAATEGVRTAAVRLASDYQVDMTTLAQRLLELEVIEAKQAGFIRTVRTTAADIVEFDLVPRHELEPPYLSHRYQKSVLRLLRAGVVSTARAADLLFDTIEEGELPGPDQLAENAIWDFV